MKTTVEIDDELLREAKRRAVDERKPLRAIIEEGLRIRLRTAGQTGPVRIKWVIAEGGAPSESNDREAIYDWLRKADDLH